MRKTLSALLLTSSMLAATPSAFANDEDHWYAGFDLGWSTRPTSTIEDLQSGLRLEADTDRSFVGGLFLGKKLGKNRLELEYLIRKNDYGPFPATALLANDAVYTVAGAIKNSTLMFNAWREIYSKDKWSLLAGAGVGLSDIAVSGIEMNNQFVGNESAVAPTMQVMAELARPIGGMEFGFGYRMVRSTKKTFETIAGDFETRAKHNEVFARLTWRFGSDSSPKPAPQPVAPAPAPRPEPKPAPVVSAKPAQPVTQPVEAEPTPLPQPYIVYFGFDSTDITSTAARTIRDAAKGFREFKAVLIQASGHTDKAGSEAYNERLSQARVEAVRDALVREGVPSSKIMISSKGESTPAVNTDDGVRNDRNRRVEIRLVR